MKSKPPCTSYIATRWYRAPETILKASRYGAEVDMWAVGTLMAELFTLRPIFAGSSELDQVFKITTTLGTPTHWKEGLRLAEQAGYSLPSASGLGLRSVVPQAGPDALTFMGELLQFDPSRRLTAREALSHRFMQVRQASTLTTCIVFGWCLRANPCACYCVLYPPGSCDALCRPQAASQGH